MSVSIFSLNEFLDIKTSILKNEKVMSALTYNCPLFSHEYFYMSGYHGDNHDKKSFDEFLPVLVSQTVAVWRRANAFTFVANYPDDWKATASLYESSIGEDGKELPSLELLQSLKSLQYNLFTNNGINYCPADYYKVLELCITVLEEEEE